MAQQTGQPISFSAFFTNNKMGATSLAVTCEVYSSNGTPGTALVTGASATEVGGGLYRYTLDGTQTGTAGDYYTIFKTTGTVDSPQIAGLQEVGTSAVQQVATVSATVAARLDATITSRQPSGPVTVATNQDKTGYSLTTAEHMAIATDAGTALVAGGYTTARAARLDNLDALITSRLAASGYTASPTLSAIVAGILDELLSAHTSAGSVGAKLGSLTASGLDPLAAVLSSGSYAPNTAGGALFRQLAYPALVAASTTPTPLPVALETKTVRRGDSYEAPEGRDLRWTIPGLPVSWNYTGARVWVSVGSDGGGLLFPPTEAQIITADPLTGTLVVSLPLPNTITDILDPGAYLSDIEIDFPDTHPVTVGAGQFVVTADVR